MEREFQKCLSNWHVISTLQKDEKLIVHPDGRLTKDPYSVVQFFGRRLWGRGLQATHDGLEQLWDITTLIVELLLHHDELTQVKHYAVKDLKDMEIASYEERTQDIKLLYEHLKVARDKGLKHLIETYNQDCKFEQLAKSIDGQLKKIDTKLAQLRSCEVKKEQHSYIPPIPKRVTFPLDNLPKKIEVKRDRVHKSRTLTASASISSSDEENSSANTSDSEEKENDQKRSVLSSKT